VTRNLKPACVPRLGVELLDVRVGVGRRVVVEAIGQDVDGAGDAVRPAEALVQGRGY